MESEESVLFIKDGFEFKRLGKGKYTLNFSMENKNIYIQKIIDFNLIKLIYDLNNDVYEYIKLDIVNENEAVGIFLIKHFFEDIGLPQRFTFFNIKRIFEDNKIIFKSQGINTHRPDGIPPKAELLSIKDLTCVCDIITQHKINFSFNICFDSGTPVPSFAEKAIGIIINKIFTRVKQFIENIVI
jgi:hypothetical protein